jgi:hypothetical protein
VCTSQVKQELGCELLSVVVLQSLLLLCAAASKGLVSAHRKKSAQKLRNICCDP